MIDLHSHILPGLDDGPSDMAGALEILRQLGAMGFKRHVATPHHRYSSWVGLDPVRVEQAVQELGEEARERGFEARIYPGMEYDLEEDVVNHVRGRPGRAEHVLLDMGFISVPMGMREIIERIRSEGLIVLLVHPERNQGLNRRKDLSPMLGDKGVRLLGNLGSLGGLYGREVRKRALEYLDGGLYWAFATDIHDARQIRYLQDGLAQMGGRGSGAIASLLTENPMTLIRPMETRL